MKIRVPTEEIEKILYDEYNVAMENGYRESRIAWTVNRSFWSNKITGCKCEFFTNATIEGCKVVVPHELWDFQIVDLIGKRVRASGTARIHYRGDHLEYIECEVAHPTEP